MTDLKQAAQQALEALMKSHTHPLLPDDCEEAITSLRAALAEPEQNPFGDDAERYARKLHEEREAYKALFTEHKPQTTHWEGCEAVHPECKTEHGVKDLSNYEFKTYKTGGAELEAGFYSTDELRDLVKALDKMNAATERSMRKMK